MTSPVSFLDSIQRPNQRILNFVEDYLSFGRAFKVLGEKKGVCQVEEDHSPISVWKKVYNFVKALTYFTLVLPVVFGVIKAVYRPKCEIVKGTAAEILPPVVIDPKIDVGFVHQARLEIEKARAEGKKVALFVGRHSDQSVPKDENTLWISLSNERQHHFKAIGSNRFHLNVDFHHVQHQLALVGQFDQIVIDWSTIKFFGGSKETNQDHIHFFTPLLVPGPDSTFIFEADAGCSSASRNIYQFTHNYGSNIYQDKGGAIPFPTGEVKEAFDQTRREDTRILLESFFEHVEYHPKEALPENEERKTNFWKVKGLTKKTTWQTSLIELVLHVVTFSLEGEPLKWSYKMNRPVERLMQSLEVSL